MELQKFFLVVGIPVLLFLTVLVLDSHSPITGITGFAVGEEKEVNPVIGSYSANPSFRAKMDYKIEEEYKKVKEEFKSEVIEPCKTAENAFLCFMEKSGGEKWRCDYGKNSGMPEKILNDFVNKASECLKNDQSGILCRFSIENFDAEKTYTITLSTEDNRIKTKIADSDSPKKIIGTGYIESDKLIYTDEKSKNIFCDNPEQVNQQLCNYADEIIIQIGKESDSNLKKFSAIVNSVSPNPKEVSQKNQQQEISLGTSNGKVIIYKIIKKEKSEGDENQYTQLKFVDEAVANLFLDPQVNAIIDLPLKKGAIYCYKSDKQVYAFDESDGQVSQRNIVYRFAVTIPNPAPKPIESLKVFDALKSEKSVILKWKQSDDTLTKSYTIYYSPKEISFIDMKMEDIQAEVSKGNIKRVQVSSEVEESQKFDSVDLSECRFTEPKSLCRYHEIDKKEPKDLKIQLSPGKLYYAESLRFSKNEDPDKKSMLIKISIPSDGEEYNFAVTAANDGNIDLDNDKSIEGNKYVLSGQNYASFASTDDLFPSSDNLIDFLSPVSYDEQAGQIEIPLKNQATVNADGTPVKDAVSYKVYYKMYSYSELPYEDDLLQRLYELQLSDFGKARIPEIISQIPSGNDKVVLKISGKLDKIVYFFVVASDDKGNPLDDLESEAKIKMGETSAQMIKFNGNSILN